MIGCIIQARMGSTRLPGKVRMKIDENETVLSFVIKQIRACNFLDKMVVATTEKNIDDSIIIDLKNLGISYFRGEENDVLDRYYKCAKKFSFSTIVRITADCPLIDPRIVDNMIKYFEKNVKLDYISNTHPISTYPKGTDVEIFNFKTLEETWKNATRLDEREHVTTYMYKNNKFNIHNVKNQEDLSKFNWSIDYKEDVEFIKRIIQHVSKKPVLMDDVLEILKNFTNINKK